MKFKSLYILFSVSLIFLLITMILLPFFLPGSIYSLSSADLSVFLQIWELNWLIILIWFILFTAVNVIFFKNRILYSLIEKENWPALVRYLEEKIYKKGNYTSRLVNLLAYNYLLLSDASAVIILENKVNLAKPSLIDANPLIFGTARILAKDVSGALHFFETHKINQGIKGGSAARDWMFFYHAFTMLLVHDHKNAGKEFTLLARMSRESLIMGLSSYFLQEILSLTVIDKYQEWRDISYDARMKLREELKDKNAWDKEVSIKSKDFHVAALSKYTLKTGRWLYGYDS